MRAAANKLVIVAVLSSALVVSPHRAQSADASSTGVINFGPTATQNNPSGLTSSVSVAGEGDSAGSAASAHTGRDSVGAAATAAPQTFGAFAQAIRNDVWSCAGCGSSGVPYSLRVRFDGVLDPLLVDPTLPDTGIFLHVGLEYFVNGTRWFIFTASYDGHDPTLFAQFSAPGNEETVTDELVFSGNTVSYDRTFQATTPGGAWGESLRALVRVEPHGPDLLSSHTVDFASTFGVESLPLSSDVAFASEGGQVATLIPEPQTYAMLLAGLGLLGFAVRRRRCARVR